jgi:hypothetical protein
MLVIILAGMALAQARAQGDTVCAGETSVWTLEEFPGETYAWELYNDVAGINFATDPGNCPASEAFFVGGVNTGDSVEIMCLVPGTYFIKVTAINSCPTNNLRVGRIVVEECYSYALFLEPEEVCEGDTAMFTFEITGAQGPWDVTFTDGTNSWTIVGITTSPFTFQFPDTPAIPGTYTYWITSVSNPYMTNNTPGDPVDLIVKPKPVTSPIYRYTP